MARRVTLTEITVKPGGDHYSKKNNPAVDFVNLIRNRAELGDPRRQDYYNYEKYERITLGLTNLADSVSGNGLLKKFTMLNQYIDTIGPDSTLILPLSVKEKVSEVCFRRVPNSQREVVTGIHSVGVDDFLNQENAQTMLEEFFREIDLYSNDITLLANRFVSPLSRIGPDYYKYWLTDTINVDGDSCIVLQFVPRNSAGFGFNGRLYAVMGDSTMFIKKASMKLSKAANVNFVEDLSIEQTYAKDSLGNRHLMSDDLSISFSLVPGTQNFYAHKMTTYSGHNYEPSPRSGVYDRLAAVSMTADAYLRDHEFWASRRGEDYSDKEAAVGDLVAQLRSIPIYYWAEKVVKVLFTGYIPFTSADKFEYGPVNTTVSFNDVEGTRLRAGFITTSNFSRHWFMRGYGAWGTKDHKWKYGGEVEYSFNAKKRHSREFPIHSIRLSHSYDRHAIGQNYYFTNPDNFFLSFKRSPDTLMVYERLTQIRYTLELENHFSVTADIANSQLDPSRYVGFYTVDGRNLGHLTTNSATIALRYAPGETFIQTLSNRFPINSDNPVIMLSHTFAPAGFAGSSPYTVNRTELMLQKRFWLSAFGYADFLIKGAHVWSRVPFTELIAPNANLSYTIQPESFDLLSPMEFLLDSSVSWNVTYWGNGVLFNQLPLFKKLKLREVVAFRGVWGTLSDKNKPSADNNLPAFPSLANPVDMGHKPYMEIAAGVDNLFKVLRLDYVWRLSYLDTPGVDRSGLRIALHFTF